MEVTKLSTKGQIVIPEKLRRGYETGASFVVSKVNEMLILKPVTGLSDNEKKELKELNTIWNKIDSGKADKYSEKEFFEAMEKW